MHSIGESELILTPRNTIYHLGLSPGQIADTIITVGDPGRVPLVSKYFDSIEHRAQHREFVTHTGRVGNKRLSVVSTGIGPDNIDIVINELDALVNIDFSTRTVNKEKRSLNIIRLGTSGALQADIPVDAFVLSSFAIGLDNLMHYYAHEDNPEERFILSDFTTHTALIGRALKPYIAEGAISLRKHFGSDFYSGITVTCPGFYGPQGRVLRAPVAYPHLIDALGTFTSRGHRVTNFEMETSATYGLSKLLSHHALSISTIVANRVHKTFSADADLAIDTMIRNALAIIEGL